MTVTAVESAVKYFKKGVETRRKGQYKAELTLSPRVNVKPPITVITAIDIYFNKVILLFILHLFMSYQLAYLTPNDFYLCFSDSSDDEDLISSAWDCAKDAQVVRHCKTCHF